MRLLILLSAIVAVNFAIVSSTDPCKHCAYNQYGVGYAATDYCNTFYKCQLKPDGGFREIMMCCYGDLVWNQKKLTCVHGKCNGDLYNTTNCPVNVDPMGNECYLLPSSTPEMYNMHIGKSIIEMPCPPRTIYDPENCTCVHGGETKCNGDPMLYFPFATHDDDVQCMHAGGASYGNAHVDEDIGALCVDGVDGYVEVPFLSNWFNGFTGSFTVSLWFNQMASSHSTGKMEGLFSNGDCFNDPSVYLTVETTLAYGSAQTTMSSPYIGGQSYPADDWNHVAVRYQPGMVSFFFNGALIQTATVSGPIKNSLAPATIGLLVRGTNEYYFSGCIDDVMVFDRYLDDAEIYWGVFNRNRTIGAAETAYEYV